MSRNDFFSLRKTDTAIHPRLVQAPLAQDSTIWRGSHSIELIELSNINKDSSCSSTGSLRDDPYWTSRKNSLELIELSSISKVILV